MADKLSKAVELYNSKKYELALQEFKQVDSDPAEDYNLAYYLGLCYTKLEQYESAMIHLEQVVTSSDNIIQVYQSRMVLSYVYAITRRLQLAKFELDQIIESGYESAQVYGAHGYVSYELGKVDEALGYLQKALTIDPDNVNALNSLGYIMAEEEKDSATAVSYCKSAVEKSPNQPAYLDSLGWACFKDGRLEQARDYLRRALNLSGGSKEIADHMRAVLQNQKKEND